MELSNKILEFLNHSCHPQKDILVPVETIKNQIKKVDQEPLFILKILDKLYLLENQGLVETTASKESSEFCARITEKGKKFLGELSNPSTK